MSYFLGDGFNLERSNLFDTTFEHRGKPQSVKEIVKNNGVVVCFLLVLSDYFPPLTARLFPISPHRSPHLKGRNNAKVKLKK